jgi:hypothetical protein
LSPTEPDPAALRFSKLVLMIAGIIAVCATTIARGNHFSSSDDANGRFRGTGAEDQHSAYLKGTLGICLGEGGGMGPGESTKAQRARKKFTLRLRGTTRGRATRWAAPFCFRCKRIAVLIDED